MIELAGDLVTTLVPYGFVFATFHDPWIAGLWIAVGVTIRWYRRHWDKPPFKAD
jgi:hypothetical protein